MSQAAFPPKRNSARTENRLGLTALSDNDEAESVDRIAGVLCALLLASLIFALVAIA
jgi:hypothetical protein